MVRASVIVPARNAEATLGRCLACLARQRTEVAFETIVVDDGSDDATAAVAEAAEGPVRVLRQQAAGPAVARNRGVAESRGEVLAFCDADCYPAAGWLEAGLGALRAWDLVQGRVAPEPDVEIGPYDRSLWIESEVGLWETANLFVTRTFFDRAGGFEDWLRPVAGKAMAEDVWFGWRVKRLGARSAFCATALSHHAVFQRSPKNYVLERRRLRHFPEMVAKMPELRHAFLHRRLFLNRRTAAFDAAVASLGAAALARDPWPLLATLPYARILVRGARVRSQGRSPVEVAVVDALADLVGAAGLARGSLESGTPVL